MNRYESYKEVNLPWLKEIPEGWGLVKNRNVFKYKKELNKNNSEKNILSLTLNGVINNDINNPIGLSPKDYATYQVFQRNDLVFKLIDLNNIKTSRVGIVHEKGIMSSAYIRFINDKTWTCSKYYYYWFYKLYIEEVFNKLGNGVRETIGKDDLLNMLSPIPPLPEQEQIANYLDWKINEIDRLIKIEKEKQILVKNVFNNELKRKYISLRRYNMVSLKRICTIFSGKEVVDEIHFKEGAIPVYGSGSIVFKYTSNVMLDGKFIIFGRKGTIGKPYIVNNKFWLVDTAYAAVNNDLVTFDYLFYLLRILNWEEFTTNTVKPSIVANQVIQTKIKLPVIKEQNAITSDINIYEKNVNTILEFISKKIKELESLKQSLISEVVTGKIDVRNVVIPEYEKVTLLYDETEEFDEMEGIEDGN
ncbi:restriction endonuclease subunit S [Mesomycoplasma ovipneumoniae]|uniref:restriction endonuclease subunit S n=1 Tax=Mesomycoplasma ovipneumoniae TaxID=29562 RepID=UPI00069E3575|nr:restriction endonuclease subunit S [Mesomycoplasma ovipneumoniae]